MNKVLVFTGSRGEWGYLRPILQELKERSLKFEIAITNMHVDPAFGSTENEIYSDGFSVDYRLPMSVSFASDYAWMHSLGLLSLHLPQVIEKSRPDIILLAGDRAETMIMASLLYYSNIPIAHIQAGELSGHKDGLARHAIGKLAHIHFASNRDAEIRLLRLGEQNFRIYNTGAPQLDDILDDTFVESGKNVLETLRLSKDAAKVIVIYHGNSDEVGSVDNYIEPTHAMLAQLDLEQIWILPNSDAESKSVEEKIVALPRKNTFISRNLPRAQFAYLMKSSTAIIGNSSVGILEAPAMGLTSINIGGRQKGRYESGSVIQMPVFEPEILKENMQKILDREDTKTQYFEYGKGESAKKIVDVLQNIDSKSPELLNKRLVEK